MREVLTVYMEQVGAEIRLAIARQGQEISKLVQCQMADFQKHTSAQIEHVKCCAEKKAKSIVRRHHAEENTAHEAIYYTRWRNARRLRLLPLPVMLTNWFMRLPANKSLEIDVPIGVSSSSIKRSAGHSWNCRIRRRI